MSSILVADVKKAIPMSLKQKNRFVSGAVSRTTRSFGFTNPVVSPNGQNVATISLPSTAWIDFSNSYIRGNVSWLSGMLLGRSVHSLIERVQIRSTSGVVLFDVSGYNVLTSCLSDATLSQADQEGPFSITTLCGSNSYRTSLAGKTVDFSFQPLIDQLRSNDDFPLHYAGGLVIDLHLSPAAVAFQNVSGGSLSNSDMNYTISNLKYVVDFVTYDEETESLARQAFMNGKLGFHYQSWRFSPDQSPSQNFDLKVQTINNSVNGLLIAMRPASAITNPAVDSFNRCCYSLDDVQIQVGGDLKDIYNGGSQLYAELEKLLDSPQSGVITPANWMGGDGTKFLIAQNLQTVKDAGFLSGYSGKGQIMVKLSYSAPLPEAVSYYTWVLHDISIQLSAENGVQVNH